MTHDPNRTSLPFNFGVNQLFSIALQDRVALAAQDYPSGACPLEPKSGLVITLDQNGKIYLDQAALSYEDFRATFPAFVRTKRPTGVYLRADGRAPYADVVQVLAVIRAAGVNDVGLVAEPETIER